MRPRFDRATLLPRGPPAHRLLALLPAPLSPPRAQGSGGVLGDRHRRRDHHRGCCGWLREWLPWAMDAGGWGGGRPLLACTEGPPPCPPTTASPRTPRSPQRRPAFMPTHRTLQEARAMINPGFDLDAYNEMVVTINGAFAKIF